MKVWCVAVIFCYLFWIGLSSLLPKSTLKAALRTGNSGNDDAIDRALYSRQLLVYGESAQVQLKHATILLIGKGALTNEIAKNMALSGVGKVLIVDTPHSASEAIRPGPSLLGHAVSLAQYVVDVNRNVAVSIASAQLQANVCLQPLYINLGRIRFCGPF